jgi:hypothetical protein
MLKADNSMISVFRLGKVAAASRWVFELRRVKEELALPAVVVAK